MNFNGETVDNNAELDSKTQNIDLATTVALTTNFLGVLEVNGVPVSGGSIPQPYPGTFEASDFKSSTVNSVNTTITSLENKTSDITKIKNGEDGFFVNAGSLTTGSFLYMADSGEIFMGARSGQPFSLESLNGNIQLNSENIILNSATITATGPLTAPLLIKTGGTNIQFLKADGSIDSNDYVNITGDTMTGSLTAPSLIKTGGTNIEYLMGDGSTLTQSATSGNSNFYLYNNTNSTTNITPVSGEVIINSLTNTTATIVYISHVTRDNIDVEVFWKFVNTLTELYLQDQNLSTNYIQYNIIAAPTITVGDKIAIPVAVVNSAGTGATSFGAGHNILVSYFTNNLEVDTRLSTLETKTQSQTATSLRTTFTGKTFIRETVGILTPQAILMDCDNTTLGPSITSTDGGLSGLKPLSLGCTDFNLNCAGFNNIRCAVGQNINLIGNVSNTGYSTTSNAFITNGGLSSQFVKGDGTLDSTDFTISSFQWSTSTITFSTVPALISTSLYMPNTSMTNIGGSIANVAQSSASTLLKIFKVASNTSAVGDGQKSGYIGNAAFPKIYPQGGFNLNLSFGIGDTNTAATSVCQMFAGILTTVTTPLFSSTLGPNITPNILGIGCDLGDTVFSFYMRGTTSGTKVATTIPCITPSTGYYNLNIYNAVGSNTAVLTFKNIVSGISQIYSTSFSAGSPTAAIINTSLLNPVVMRGMAVAGGITGSSITHISRFQLSIK